MKTPQSRTMITARPILISVESRKGGVGKTTAALNLAKELVQRRGYQVLLMDLDFAGTNIADEVMSSSVWRDMAALVAENNEHGVDLFELCQRGFFPTTREVSASSTNDSSGTENQFVFTSSKINVIGSSIAGTSSGEDPFTSDRNPSIIFDQVHSVYILEIIKDLVRQFCEWAHRIGDGKMAVVFDNAPGYSGLQPWLHDWITDVGPTLGKTVFVSSVDGQDIIACGYACRDIADLTKAKQVVAEKFHDIRNAEKTVNIKVSIIESEKRFFNRLAMVITDESTQSNDKQYLTSWLDWGQDVKQKVPRDYIAVIVNKVPADVLRKRVIFNLGKVFAGRKKFLTARGATERETVLLEESKDLLSTLFGEKGMKGCAIRVDDDIALQFCGEYVEDLSSQSGAEWSDVKRTTSAVMEALKPMDSEDWVGDYRKFERVYNACCAASEKAVALLTSGIGLRSELLEPQGLLPQRLDKLAKDVGASLGVPESMLPTARVAQARERREDKWVELMGRKIVSVCKSEIPHAAPSLVKGLTSAYCALLEYGIGRGNWALLESDHMERVSRIIALCVLRHADLLEEGRNGPKSGSPSSLRGSEFMRQVRVTIRRTGTDEDRKWREACRRVLPEGKRGQVDGVFKATCRMLARMADVREDTRALLEGLMWARQATGTTGYTAGRIERAVTLALYKVIVSKKERHQHLGQLLTEAGREGREMAPFEDALRSILDRWAL